MEQLVLWANLQFFNIRGLYSNLNSVHHHLQSVAPHALFLTETQISNPLSLSRLNFPGYLLYSSFRPKAGVCAFVRSDIPASHLSHMDLSDPFFQLIWLKLNLPSLSKFICCLYRSPNSNSHSALFDHLSKSIESILQSSPSSEIIILGDFNVHNTSWLKHSSSTDAAGSEAEVFSILNDLTQLVTSPTRIPDRPGDHPNTLDLFLTNKPSIYSSTFISAPLGSSDHCIVSVEHPYSRFKSLTQANSSVWKYNKADWDALRSFYSSFPWNDVCFSSDVSSSAQSVSEIITLGMSLFIPHSLRPGRKSSPKWFDHACSAAVSEKNRCFRIWSSSPSPDTRSAYIDARNRCSSTISKAKSSFNSKLATKLSNCPTGSRSFWSLAKSISSNFAESSFPPLVNTDGSISSQPKEKADTFASLFASNSNLNDSGHSVPFYPPPSLIMPSFKFFTRSVRQELCHLEADKAVGPDGIPAIVLKMCAPELAPILSRLYNLSLTSGVCPASWKTAHVFPIPKKGDRSNPSNYRPIAITSILCKVMESLINKKLLHFFESSSSLSDHQYGFRKARSTGDLLAYVTHIWSSALESFGESRVIALDISKAFDRVWHANLLAKLKSFGVNASVCSWIHSFLSDRSIAARIDGALSDNFSINSGVPQGSVISPILFLVYINDLLNSTSNLIHSFADDSTLHSTMHYSSQKDCHSLTNDRSSMAQSLNSDLSTIQSWGSVNLVSFNHSKTQTLTISKKHSQPSDSLSLNGSALSSSHSIHMLGLHISNNLSWKEHIKSIAKSASRKLCFLYRSKRLFTPAQLLTLYKAQIRPILEYCCHIWGGASSSTLSVLDKIQEKAVRLIGDSSLTSNLQSLSHRRSVACLSLFYRYFHGMCSSELSSIVPERQTFSRTTRLSSTAHPFTVRTPRCRTNIFASSFIPRTVALWNKLPASCFPDTPNVNTFKSRVNRLAL